MIRVVILSLLLAFSIPSSYAVVEQVNFANKEQEQRYRNLIAELRCLVCQNQNLADSDADLAKDLRRKTAEMIKNGLDDKEILNYMRDRYGDFVLYRPPFNYSTALLWLGPFILLLAVGVGIITHIKRRQQEDLVKPTHSNDEAARIKVRNLMRETPNLDQQSSFDKSQPLVNDKGQQS